jgi:NTP pyrophosphatase (non-canonical NTP hydrolase)
MDTESIEFAELGEDRRKLIFDGGMLYEQVAKGTAKYPPEIGLFYTVMGLVGEAGELANKTKKIFRDHDGRLSSGDRDKMIFELGDVVWYCAMLAKELGTSIGDVMLLNLEKLAQREANGTIKGEGDKR